MPKDAATIFSRRTLYNMVAFQVSTNVAIGVCVCAGVCAHGGWKIAKHPLQLLLTLFVNTGSLTVHELTDLAMETGQPVLQETTFTSRGL